MIATLIAAALAASSPDAAAKAAIETAVGRQLKDGESARYLWPAMDPEAVVYCGLVNSKNSYGAYVGFVPFKILGATGTDGTFRVYDATIGAGDDAPVVAMLCADAGFDLDPAAL